MGEGLGFGDIADLIGGEGGTGISAVQADVPYNPAFSTMDVTSGVPSTTPTSSWLSNFGNIAKSALPWIKEGIGLTGAAGNIVGMKQLADQTAIAKSAERRQAGIAKTAEAAAAPVRAFGEQELTQAAAGKIDPAIEKQIQLWVQGAKQKAQDYAARSGQGDSQQLVDWLAWIDQMGEAMRTQAIQGEQGLGITAEGTAGNILGVGGAAAGGAGAAAAGQQTSLAQLIAAANQEISKLGAPAA